MLTVYPGPVDCRVAHSFDDVQVLKKLAADAGVARDSMFRVLRLNFEQRMPDIRHSNASQLPAGIPTLLEVRMLALYRQHALLLAIQVIQQLTSTGTV